MRKYSTIHDIANKVGVSHMTVSRVLSGKGPVKESTRRQILLVAEQLNYTRNGLASGFRGGKTQSAGIVWQFVDPWAGDTAVGLWVMQALQRHGMATYQSQFSQDVPEMGSVLDALLHRRVDVLVIGGTPDVLEHADIRRRLERVPAVVTVCFKRMEGFAGDQIIHDRNAAIREVVQHLAAIGRRRPTLLLSLEVESNHDKLRAFQAACREFGIADHPRLLTEITVNPAPTLNQPFAGDTARYQQTLEQAWPGRAKIDVDAIFSFNDFGAMAACNFVRSRGLRVPEDVAVIGFNDDPADHLWQPPLASGDRCRAELAEAVREMVISRLDDPELKPREKTVRMKFVWRESAGGTGPLRR